MPSDTDTNTDTDIKLRAALYAALARAQLEVQPLPKDSKNDYHDYKYASSEAIFTEGKRALATQGLALIPLRSEIQDPEGDRPAMLISRYLLTHEDGGDRIIDHTPWPIIPQRGRPFDKAVAAAETTSLAYLVRNLLLMPRCDPSDDMDHDGKDKGNGRSQRPHGSTPAPAQARGHQRRQERPNLSTVRRPPQPGKARQRPENTPQPGTPERSPEPPPSITKPRPTADDLRSARQRETPGEKERRQAAQDPDWSRDRPGFCKACKDVGLDYYEVGAWSTFKGWGMPSGWPSERRDGFLASIVSQQALRDEIRRYNQGADDARKPTRYTSANTDAPRA